MSAKNKQLLKPDIQFPDPRQTETIEDILCVGGRLSPGNLIESYRLGIFPWPHKGYPLLWFCPEQRGVLDFKDLHISQSLKKWIKKNKDLIRVSVNENFSQVIHECKNQKRQGQSGTWITVEMEKNYTLLQHLGYALSVECWQRNLEGAEEELVGGIYGVRSKTYFSCESMFFKKSNMSKYAFLKLVEVLQAEGLTWMDLQMITDVSGSFGGKYISKSEFLQRIQ